jgi:hypothetical protein
MAGLRATAHSQTVVANLRKFQTKKNHKNRNPCDFIKLTET